MKTSICTCPRWMLRKVIKLLVEVYKNKPCAKFWNVGMWFSPSLDSKLFLLVFCLHICRSLLLHGAAFACGQCDISKTHPALGLGGHQMTRKHPKTAGPCSNASPSGHVGLLPSGRSQNCSCLPVLAS